MNVLNNIATNDDRIPSEYRNNRTLDEIRKDIDELFNAREVTNPHILNLKSLLYPTTKKVVGLEIVKDVKTVDLEIKQDTHSYWANGTPVHNTINIPTDYPFEDFQKVYTYAYQKGLKGVTTFRFNPENFQGVLVKKDDLANTEYTFTMSDGTDHTFKGDDIIIYEGEETTAANLFDALKEGYYGKL